MGSSCCVGIRSVQASISLCDVPSAGSAKESCFSVDLFPAESCLLLQHVTGEENGSLVEKSLQQKAGLEKRARVPVETGAPTSQPSLSEAKNVAPAQTPIARRVDQ